MSWKPSKNIFQRSEIYELTNAADNSSKMRVTKSSLEIAMCSSL